MRSSTAVGLLAWALSMAPGPASATPNTPYTTTCTCVGPKSDNVEKGTCESGLTVQATVMTNPNSKNQQKLAEDRCETELNGRRCPLGTCTISATAPVPAGAEPPPEDDAPTAREPDDCGVKNGQPNPDLNELEPDRIYTIEGSGYRYFTDAHARVVRAEATIDQEMLERVADDEEKCSRQAKMQYMIGREGNLDQNGKVDEKARKTDCFDGGHLIRAAWGGPGERVNTVPMATRVNRSGGTWFRLEETWRRAIKDGATVEITILLDYPAWPEGKQPPRPEGTPTRLHGQYTIRNGQQTTRPEPIDVANVNETPRACR